MVIPEEREASVLSDRSQKLLTIRNVSKDESDEK